MAKRRAFLRRLGATVAASVAIPAAAAQTPKRPKRKRPASTPERKPKPGLVIPRVSVNVSALQLRNPSFAAAVEGALNSSTTPPSYLELEVTESLLFDAGPDAVATLERLRERGVEIAVDDFGTGYSSFAYVKQQPANILKLDRTFIVDVVDNPQAAIIATAIMEMASALGKIVVAEGVETAQQVHVPPAAEARALDARGDVMREQDLCGRAAAYLVQCCGAGYLRG